MVLFVNAKGHFELFDSRNSAKVMTLGPTDAKLFRERLAERREAKGLTQAQLSYKLSKASNYIMRVETGRIGTPPLDTIAEIANHLDLSISDLFFFEGKNDSPEILREKILKIVETADVNMLQRYYRLLLVASEK